MVASKSTTTYCRVMTLAGLIVLTSTAWATDNETTDSELNTQSITMIKPLISSHMVGEALTGWIATQSLVANNGAWGPIQARITADVIGNYSEGGLNYSIYDLKGSGGESSGVGFVIQFSEIDCFGGCNTRGPFAMQGNSYLSVKDASQAVGSSTFNYLVKFVVSGVSILPGDIIVAGQSVGDIFLEGNFGTNNPLINMNAFNLTYDQQGCVASVSPSTISMGVVSPFQFSGPGSTVNGTTPATVSLQCNDGLGVFASMTDQNNIGNTSDTLALTLGTNTATGVGVRFLREGSQPIIYGPSSAFVDQSSTTQWQVKSKTDSNNISFTLTPQYIQTGDITPGDANAVASITFAYD